MGKSSKHTLKNTLHQQQSRLSQKQKSAQVAEQKSKKAQSIPGGPKSKGRITSDHSLYKHKVSPASGSGSRQTIPFTCRDRILLVGEGNFSFTRALVCNPPNGLEDISASHVTATAYDAEEECYEKYSDAQEIVAQLREKGVTILFSIDATKLEKHPTLKGAKWDKIVWNFPHAGQGITDQDRNILSNQVLILDFLRSASHLLKKGPIPIAQDSRKRKRTNEDEDDSEDDMEERMEAEAARSRGSVLVTLRNHVPYTQWDIPRLAKNPPPPTSSNQSTPPYDILRSFVFYRSQWKGYEHRMTKGERAHGTGTTGHGGEDRTWEFYLRD